MKFIRRLILIIILFIVGAIGFYMWNAHSYYEELIATTPMESLVNEVMTKENYVSYDQLPDSLVQATVSIEDRRFFVHTGVDIIGTARAVVSQFSSEFVRSGGSTITQQTVKNLYGMFDNNIYYKGCQMFLAWDMESKYSKEEIFAIYVNIINYGDDNIGIYDASHNYFGVDPINLTVAQSSLLAGIPQSPTYYQLSTGYDNAKHRQYYVLKAMADLDYISSDQVDVIYNQSVY